MRFARAARPAPAPLAGFAPRAARVFLLPPRPARVPAPVFRAAASAAGCSKAGNPTQAGVRWRYDGRRYAPPARRAAPPRPHSRRLPPCAPYRPPRAHAAVSPRPSVPRPRPTSRPQSPACARAVAIAPVSPSAPKPARRAPCAQTRAVPRAPPRPRRRRASCAAPPRSSAPAVLPRQVRPRRAHHRHCASRQAPSRRGSRPGVSCARPGKADCSTRLSRFAVRKCAWGGGINSLRAPRRRPRPPFA